MKKKSKILQNKEIKLTQTKELNKQQIRGDHKV